jgi:hypothetical protein
MCAALRRSRSQNPRPVPRLGIEENQKITPHQARTATHATMREGFGTTAW